MLIKIKMRISQGTAAGLRDNARPPNIMKIYYFTNGNGSILQVENASDEMREIAGQDGILSLDSINEQHDQQIRTILDLAEGCNDVEFVDFPLAGGSYGESE